MLILEELGFSFLFRDCGSSKSHLIVSQEQKEIEKDRKQMQFDHKDDHYHQKHDTTIRYPTDGIPRLSVC